MNGQIAVSRYGAFAARDSLAGARPAREALAGAHGARCALALLVAGLALGLGLGVARPGFAADDPPPPPPSETSQPVDPPIESPPPALETTPVRDVPVRDVAVPDVPPGRFVAEVLDSTYFIEPAEFFALDLPVRSQNGAVAAHILGDVSVVGGRHDIIVRIFRSGDYQNWLKRRGGRQTGPVWSSPRQRAVRLDQELPQGTPLVLLLDNGYSLRTPKRVRVQVQLQYQGEPGAQNVSAQPARVPEEGDVVPRSNADEEFPPPPPPPPSEGGK